MSEFSPQPPACSPSRQIPPKPSHQTRDFPASTSIHTTSRVSVRMIPKSNYILTVIQFHATIARDSLPPTRPRPLPLAHLLCFDIVPNSFLPRAQRTAHTRAIPFLFRRFPGQHAYPSYPLCFDILPNSLAPRKRLSPAFSSNYKLLRQNTQGGVPGNANLQLGEAHAAFSWATEDRSRITFSRHAFKHKSIACHSYRKHPGGGTPAGGEGGNAVMKARPGQNEEKHGSSRFRGAGTENGVHFVAHYARRP
jgi:hypothetical protein